MTKKRTVKLDTMIRRAIAQTVQRAVQVAPNTKRARDELEALVGLLGGLNESLAVVTGGENTNGMVDAVGDLVDAPTNWDDDTDHGEDSDHEHGDPDPPTGRPRRIGFLP